MVESISNDQQIFDLEPKPLPIGNKSSPILFDKYVFKRGDTIPDDLDIKGCFAISKTTKPKYWLHFLIIIAQKIHAFFFGKRQSKNKELCHGMIIFGKDKRDGKDSHFIHGHAAFGGLKTCSWDYLNDEQLTEVVIYRPRDEVVREKLIEYSKQTVFDKTNPNGNFKQVGFGVGDMIASIFHKPRAVPNKRIMLQTARAVADLLTKNQFLDTKGTKPRKFFCTPYATTILQGALLTKNLTEAETQELLQDGERARTRNEVAERIYNLISSPTSEHSISKAFSECSINKLDGRYAMSYTVADTLDEFSRVPPIKNNPVLEV